VNKHPTEKKYRRASALSPVITPTKINLKNSKTTKCGERFDLHKGPETARLWNLLEKNEGNQAGSREIGRKLRSRNKCTYERRSICRAFRQSAQRLGKLSSDAIDGRQVISKLWTASEFVEFLRIVWGYSRCVLYSLNSLILCLVTDVEVLDVEGVTGTWDDWCASYLVGRSWRMN